MTHNIPTSYSDAEKLRELSVQYIYDAHQFCTQAEVLLTDDQLKSHTIRHHSYLNKIMVTLYMSIECSLKSMVCISHRTEAPADVYKNRIRRAGHDFSHLRSHVDDFSSRLGDSSLEAELDALADSKVSDRYCLEISSESDHLSDFNIDDDEVDTMIETAKELLGTAKALSKKVWELRKDAFSQDRVVAPREVKAILREIKT